MPIHKLRKDFELIKWQFFDIKNNYNTYTALFNDENRNLLTATAPKFFTDVAEMMKQDWILQVSKIMDRANTDIRGINMENLTIKLIDKQLIECSLETKEISLISTRILKYGNKLQPARNKLIAHNDREHQINGKVLGKTSEAELQQFLADIQKYCDLVSEALEIESFDFTSTHFSEDVNKLIKVLKIGTNI
jgi:hypothetical protein